jgi:hypothetical protein
VYIFRSVPSPANIALSRHVALIQVHGKEYSLKPLPLRTARPFVLEEVVLSEVAEEEEFELEDQMEITKYLRSRVNVMLFFVFLAEFQLRKLLEGRLLTIGRRLIR